jgi:hydroxymethyl cephem carbamoyltransferase
MLIMAIKPGHDGAIAVLRDKSLLHCLEAEKDSFLRYSDLTPSTIFEIAERLDGVP